MEKKTYTMIEIFIFILFITSQSITVYSMRTCQTIQEPNVICEIITPVIECSTYDLYNSSHDIVVDDGTMSQIGDTGTYNFSINQSDTGTHKIILCDNMTGTIEIAEYSLKAIYDDTNEIQVNQSSFVTATNFATLTNASDIRSDIATAQADLDSPNQYKADVSALATTAQLTQNTSAILENVSTGQSSIITYIASAISSLLVSFGNTATEIKTNVSLEHILTRADIAAIPPTNWSKGQIYIWNNTNRSLTENVTTTDSDKTSIASKVWGWATGYINPSGSSLNANNTLKTIAQNTEMGGY